MKTKPNQKTFRLSAVVSGHILNGTVAFSPAPRPGIFTALAELEAKRILNGILLEEIEAGHL